MGNLWERCCNTDHVEHDTQTGLISGKNRAGIGNSPPLRVPIALPKLRSARVDKRRSSQRFVRIDSLSPILQVDDEYNSESENSDAGYLGFSSPPRLGNQPSSSGAIDSVPTSAVATTSPPIVPRHSSGLRLLLSNTDKASPRAASIDSEGNTEQKDDSGDIGGLDNAKKSGRGLHRVERLGSLHSVLSTESETAKFASAPVAALKESELPVGLVIAFLDDSAVSRSAFQKKTLKKFQASEKSFVCGSTIAEAKAFSDEVILKKPDIVVLDHCLDYEVSPGVFESVKGTDIAKEIRDRGYDGCIIMQSERDSLKDEADYDIVDGVTGRDSAHSAIVTARVVAMARKARKQNGSFAPPSSTQSSYNSRGDASFSFDLERRGMDGAE